MALVLGEDGGNMETEMRDEEAEYVERLTEARDKRERRGGGGGG